MVSKKRGRVDRLQSKAVPLHKPNIWVVLSVALLLIGLTVLTTVGSSSLTGNTIQSVGYLNKGSSLHLAVQDVPGLETVFTHADEIIKYGKIIVEVDESIPFDRAYVSKFKVSSEGKFGPLQFTFKVKEQDLNDQGISRYDLRLYHSVKEYSLQLLKVNHGYIYYVVTVPSMGNFVLGRVEAVVEEKKAEETVQKPVAVPEQESTEAVEKEALEPLVGRVAEMPSEPEQKSIWTRITNFFKNWFN